MIWPRFLESTQTLPQKIVLKFMTGGHTKFSSDLVFGLVRQAINTTEAHTAKEFLHEIMNNEAQYSKCVAFDQVNCVRDQKEDTKKLFKKLPGFRSQLYYKIIIEAINGLEHEVRFHSSKDPGFIEEKMHDFLRYQGNILHLESEEFFPLAKEKTLGAARLNELRNDVWKHIKNWFTERDADVNRWWNNYLNSLEEYT